MTFVGDKRICAGGHYLETISKYRNDAAHTTDLQVTIRKKNDQNQWILVPTTDFQVSIENGASPENAQLLKVETNTSSFVSAPFEIKTDAQSQFSVKMISGRKPGQATLLVKAKEGNEWKSIGSQSVVFARPESKRLFGIELFDQNYQNDTGWQFHPPIFESPGPENQTITCRIYLRFRKDTNAELVNTVYFDANGTPLGTPHEPLWNVLGVPNHQLWLPVNGHTLRVRFKSIDSPSEQQVSIGEGGAFRSGTIVSLPLKSSKVTTFWDAVAQKYIVSQTIVNGAEQKNLSDARPVLPTFIDVVTKPTMIPDETGTLRAVDGVAEFTIRAGNQVHRATELKFSVENITFN